MTLYKGSLYISEIVTRRHWTSSSGPNFAFILLTVTFIEFADIFIFEYVEKDLEEIFAFGH